MRSPENTTQPAVGEHRAVPFTGKSETEKYRVLRSSSFCWTLSRLLAKAAAIVVIASLLMLALSRPLNLKARLVVFMPEPVVRFFTEESAGPDPAALEKMRSTVAEDVNTIIPKPAKAAGRSAGFGLGSTQAEVRALQGAPTTESAQVWRYGASEVYFAGGRVVGWNTAPGSPLKTR